MFGGKLKYYPIPSSKVEIDPYSGFWGAMVACSFITLALGIVLCHKFDLTKIFNIGKILYQGQSLDLLLLVCNKFSMNTPLLFKLIFTGGKTILTFGALLVSSIILCRNIYGFNWIVKNKDGTMNNNLRYKTVPENVKRIPKIYFGWMGTMTLVFIICVAIMHGYRFNAQIE